MLIKKVLISEELLNYLEKRNLINQYKKIKKYILDWNFRQINLKLREPKNEKIYYFRINKQFRAFATIEDYTLKIYDIDNHQN